MASSNPFAVLANSQPADGPTQGAHIVGEEDPQEIQVENVGFLALNGDKKVQLLPQGYATDSLPPSSASLLAIANKRGLFAAAGPSHIVAGTTSSLRDAFANGGSYNAQLSIPTPTPISHVAFNADESYLFLGATSGGIAVYSVSDIASGNGQPETAFEIGTDGVGLREIKPNPVVSDLVAVVTTNGNVRMLNLSSRGFVSNANGSTVLKSGAGTVAWSQRGRQFVAGLGNGTITQMTPEGEEKALLPGVPNVENHFVSSIVWLENHLFIVTHTPVPSDPSNNDSLFHALIRSPGATTGFQYRRLPDPSPPYGMDSRAPPYFFNTYLKHYQPHIKDLIIFSSTCGTDVGVVARFSAQSGEVLADTLTTIGMVEDSRRAQLPLSQSDMMDTSPIGMVLDLSSTSNVQRPVGGEEIEESPGPLPILMLLNHEGTLSAWNVIYDDAINNGEKYNGMMVYSAEQPQQPSTPAQAQPSASPFAAQRSSFGSGGAFGTGTTPNPSPFANPLPSAQVPTPSSTSNIAFGQSSFGSRQFAGNSFGQSSTPAFGNPASLGGNTAFGQTSLGTSKPSPWIASTSTPATTAPSVPAFGQTSTPTPGGTVFGQASPFGSAKPTFGQPAKLGGSPFSQPSPSIVPTGGSTSSSGFGAYANKGGFAAAASGEKPTESIFGSGKSISIPTADSASIFGTGSKPAAFGSQGDGTFKLSAGFQPDTSQSGNSHKQSSDGSLGAFGTGFGDVVGSLSAQPQSKDEDMSGSSSPALKTEEKPTSQASALPPIGVFGGSQPKLTSSQFGSTKSSPFAGVGSLKPTSNPFAAFGRQAQSPLPPSLSNPFATRAQSSPFASPPTVPKSPSPPPAPLPPDFSELKIKSEPVSSDEGGIDGSIPEAPLPPDPVSKAPYAPESTTSGGTPAPDIPGSPSSIGSVAADDAPLPPDFAAPPKKTVATPSPPALPAEDEDEDAQDDEGEEDQADDEREEDEDPNLQAATPRSTFSYEPKPKDPSPSDGKSGIFGQNTTYSSTFGKGGGFQKNAPFSSFANPPSDVDSEDDEDDNEDEDDDEGNLSAKKVPLQRSKVSDYSSGIRGKVKPRISIGAMPTSRDPIPPPRSAAPFISLGNFGQSSFSSHPPRPAAAPKLAHNLPQQGRGDPTLARHVSSLQEEKEEVQSEVDSDREYSDREDKKVREQLVRGKVKPLDSVPEIKKIKEVEVSENFSEMFDAIYLSGNVMVNKLGQTARGLAGYHLAQRTPIEGIEHNSADDMKPSNEWHLCEMTLVKRVTEELLQEVHKENEQNPGLEDKRKIAAKGFIKLDTKETEIKRLLAVHNDPFAAARARARLLAPEQQLQQRKLRKAFTRIEKSLKEVEHSATVLKAKTAARDRHHAIAKVQPPTAEAVQNTIMKLTAMVERKTGEVEYLEEKLNRMRLGSRGRSTSLTPGRLDSPERETPEKGAKGNSVSLIGPPALTMIEKDDVQEVKEEQQRRREAGRRFRGALTARAGRMTPGRG